MCRRVGSAILVEIQIRRRGWVGVGGFLPPPRGGGERIIGLARNARLLGNKRIGTLFLCWQALGDGAYLHLGNSDEEEMVITVTGVPEARMAGMNVLLVGW